MDADIVIIGAGVIGLAIAERLTAEGRSVVLLEKEKQYGTGISSRSTETIHAGIYYEQGSLKARLCREGKTLLYEHCKKYGVPHKRIGKLFVASNEEGKGRLEATKAQAIKNGIEDLIELDRIALKKIEPDIEGVAALLSPSSGIIDSHALMKSLFTIGRSKGMTFAAYSPVVGAESRADGWKVSIGGREPEDIMVRSVINAAGLYSVEVARKVFPKRSVPKLHPTKGSYLRYFGRSPLRHIVYPAIVPGLIEERVDATPDLAGSLRFGPNIEPTKNLDDFSIDPGLSAKMTAGIKRYLPRIDMDRLQPDFSGIRPKIYGPDEPVKDFCFEWADKTGWLDLWGMESPGLTAALAIARHVERLMKDRGLL